MGILTGLVGCQDEILTYNEMGKSLRSLFNYPAQAPAIKKKVISP